MPRNDRRAEKPSALPWYLRRLPLWVTAQFIAQQQQLLGQDVRGLSDDLQRLREALLKPTIEIAVGKPQDKDL